MANNDDKKAIICKAIAEGETYKIACAKAGISDETFRRWRMADVDFVAQIKEAETQYNNWYTQGLLADCKKSLKTLINGTEYEEVSTEYENDKNGNPRIKKQKRVKKMIPPNVTAIIFALTNRDPEHWKNRQTSEMTADVKTEAKTDLSALPDELLAQVLEKLDK